MTNKELVDTLSKASESQDNIALKLLLVMAAERITRLDQLQGQTVWCSCGDGIMPDSGAKCGNCLAAESASAN